MGLLSFERSTSTRILRDFRCGVKEMDDFIHFRLDNYLSQHTPFITVDAYVTLQYSAVPFYEKCGFSHLENQDRSYDTMRMILNIGQPIDKA